MAPFNRIICASVAVVEFVVVEVGFEVDVSWHAPFYNYTPRRRITRWRLAQRNASNTRQVVQVHWPEGHHTRVHRPRDTSTIAQAFYEGKAWGL